MAAGPPQSDNTALISAAMVVIGTITGSLITAVITGLNTWKDVRLAVEARKEDKRRESHRERLDILGQAIKTLIEVRASFEELIVTEQHRAGDGSYAAAHGRLIGQAIAALLSVNDEKLRHIAINRLTPYLVEDDGELGDYKNRNRSGLSDAVIRLAQLQAEEIE